MINYLILSFFFFFFQAEDGIRDLYVTGVQTCALPISLEGTSNYPDATFTFRLSYGTVRGYEQDGKQIVPFTDFAGLYQRSAEHENKRSEERRVGKECRSRWSPDH